VIPASNYQAAVNNRIAFGIVMYEHFGIAAPDIFKDTGYGKIALPKQRCRKSN
jgi:hypothetical protein